MILQCPLFFEISCLFYEEKITYLRASQTTLWHIGMKFVLHILGLLLWDLLPNRIYYHARKSFWARQSVIFPAKHTSRCVAFLTSDCVLDSISQIALLSTEMRAAQDQVYSAVFNKMNHKTLGYIFFVP